MKQILNLFLIFAIGFLFFTSCTKKATQQSIFQATHFTNCQQIAIGKAMIESLSKAPSEPFSVNLPSLDFKDKKTKFRLALSDENKNGTYTDSLIDKAFLLEYGKDSVRLCLALSVSETCYKPEMMIVSDGEYYAIKEANSKELSFQIVQLTKSPLSNPDISTYSKINDLNYELLMEAGEANLKSLLNQDKMVYIEFWGTWCRGCIQIIPDLKLLAEEYGDELNILSLNAKDDLDDARKFVEEKQLNWAHGIADEELTKRLLVAGYPFGILLDSNGELIERGIKPKKVMQKYLH